MPDVIRPCVSSKGYSGMPCSTLPDRECSLSAIMEFHSQRHLTVYDVQGTCCHATSNVILMCVHSKGDDGMPHATSSIYVCSPRMLMACHSRARSTVCVLQGILLHSTPDVARPCVCSQRAMMSCHAHHRLTMHAFPM